MWDWESVKLLWEAAWKLQKSGWNLSTERRFCFCLLCSHGRRCWAHPELSAPLRSQLSVQSLERARLLWEDPRSGHSCKWSSEEDGNGYLGCSAAEMAFWSVWWWFWSTCLLRLLWGTWIWTFWIWTRRGWSGCLSSGLRAALSKVAFSWFGGNQEVWVCFEPCLWACQWNSSVLLLWLLWHADAGAPCICRASDFTWNLVILKARRLVQQLIFAMRDSESSSGWQNRWGPAAAILLQVPEASMQALSQSSVQFTLCSHWDFKILSNLPMYRNLKMFALWMFALFELKPLCCSAAFWLWSVSLATCLW